MIINNVETIKDFSREELGALKAELKSRGSCYFITKRPKEFEHNGRSYEYVYYFLCRYREHTEGVTYHEYLCLGNIDKISMIEAYNLALSKIDNGAF